MIQAGVVQLPYSGSSTTKVDFNFIGWIKSSFVGESLTTTDSKKVITHDDILPFSFAPLDQIRNDLAEAGYTAKEVDREIEALSELPQYAKKNLRNKRG